MKIKDKIIIITGASAGIGRATATLLAREGAKIAVADVSESGGNQTVAEIIAAGVIGPVRFFAIIFAPLARLLSATTDFVISLLGIKRGQEPAVTEAEVRVLIAKGEETGIFEPSEREMVEGVLSLGDRRITSLMTPRTEVVLVDLRDGPAEAEKLIVENARYGYLPAIDGDIDRIIGLLPVKECLAAIASRSFEDPLAFLRASVFVPESVSALKAFALLKSGDVKTALILDEYGSLAGLITLSDIFESIVGDIPGASDDDEPEIVQHTRRKGVGFIEDGLLAKHVGEAWNTACSNHRAADDSAAIGKWSHRLLHFLEKRIATEGPVPTPECAVNPRVKLVLMVGVVGRSGVVICGGREIGGRGKTRQQGLCGWVQRRIDYVLRKLLSHEFAGNYSCSRRVKNLRYSGKDALSFAQSGDGGYAGHAD